MKIPIGVTTAKKIIPITIGDTIRPSIIPNLNHILFNGDKTFESIKPKNKKIIEIKNDHHLIFSSFIKGHKDISRKTIKKTMPKLRFELILTLLFLGIVN
tara:strand:- start:177 stop:476 length:300 start_codon:yes stop_codon:yes gene_type:complete